MLLYSVAYGQAALMSWRTNDTIRATNSINGDTRFWKFDPVGAWNKNESDARYMVWSDTVGGAGDKIMTKHAAESEMAIIESDISHKLNISDTAAMLDNYLLSINSSMVIAALGYTPYNATNPSSFISASALSPYKLISDSGRGISQYATGYDLNKVRDSVTSVMATALSSYYTKVESDTRYLQSINSSMITTALGYTPYNATNPSNYIAASALTPYKLISDSGRGISQYATGYDLNKVRDSLATLISSGVTTSRTIATTSPLQGGGDLSANRTFSILNAAADASTKGAATFEADYFNDNGSGLITFNPTHGTGTVSANAVTINAPKGRITVSPNILAGATLAITFTNSFISANSTISVQIGGSGNTLSIPLQAYVRSQTSGSCVIALLNISLLSVFNTGIVIDFFIVN